MDAKKLLIGVVTISVGFMVGLYISKKFMSGMKTTPSTPAETPTDQEIANFGYGGYDY